MMFSSASVSVTPGSTPTSDSWLDASNSATSNVSGGPAKSCPNAAPVDREPQPVAASGMVKDCENRLVNPLSSFNAPAASTTAAPPSVLQPNWLLAESLFAELPLMTPIGGGACKYVSVSFEHLHLGHISKQGRKLMAFGGHRGAGQPS